MFFHVVICRAGWLKSLLVMNKYVYYKNLQDLHRLYLFLRPLEYLPMIGFLTLLFPIFILNLPATKIKLTVFFGHPAAVYVIHYTFLFYHSFKS